ncbi:MAG TPA: YhjD/YihY/BrkB family envelope integrity protein [Micromonosporaceae bacterium]|jgi:membrane protein
MSVRSHPFVTGCLAWGREFGQRLIAVRVVESSIVLAAQAFLALFPLVIVITALIPSGASNGLARELRNRYGLSGLSDSATHQLLAERTAVQQSLSAFSFVLVLASATAFTRALQRVYQSAWGLEKLGLRGLWRWFAWLLGLIVYFSILGAIAHLISHGGVMKPLATVLGFVLWWWTPFLLLGGRVRARVLLPGALIITAALGVAVYVSAAVMPRTIRNNEASYGPIGVVFAVESWFVVLTGALVVGTALGATIGRSEGRLGTWVRGTSDTEGWRRTVKPIHRPRSKLAHARGETAIVASGDATEAETRRADTPESRAREPVRSTDRTVGDPPVPQPSGPVLGRHPDAETPDSDATEPGPSGPPTG